MPDWEINGIKGNGQVPSVVNSKRGSLIILGTASNMWEDFFEALKIDGGADLMCLNLAPCFFRQQIEDKKISIHHWVSVHPEFFEIADCYLLGEPWKHSTVSTKRTDYVWGVSSEGSSGAFACRIALALGYKKVILCGIPMDNRPHIYDMPETKLPWAEQDHCRSSWEWSKANEFQGRVKSMSGWTKELLGRP
jgi:hypothetical protein